MPVSDVEIVDEHESPGCPSHKMDSSADHLAFINMDPSAFNSAEAYNCDEQLPLPRPPKRSYVSIEDTSTSFSATKKNRKKKKVLKKPKTHGPVEDADSVEEDWDEQVVRDADDDVPRTFTVYVQVWSSSALSRSSNKKSAKVSTVDVVSKGPFKCTTTDSFASFKSHTAAALPCRLSMLPVSKFEWKFENQAQGAPRKKVADRTGYEALLDAVKARRRHENVVVWLYTPAPKKEEEDWDTGAPDHIDQPFDFDQEADAGFSDAKIQLDGMVQKVKAAQAEIERTYPVGGCALFPDKRVWHNKQNDTYFELSHVRTKYWAANIVAGRCDISAPPVSAHFSDKSKLKIPTHMPQPNLTVLGPSGAASSNPMFPHAPNQYYPGLYMLHPQFNLPYTHMTPYPPPIFPSVNTSASLHPPGLPRTMSTSSSPGSTTSHNVTLEEFCAKYHIPESDQDKLALMEYRPGNRAVEDLEESEWRSVGGFTKLGWEAFRVAHRKFCKAIKAGTWA
ncbi:hypothetical protein BKA83DRAFT_4163406 [Pisolithus microcarpus]|nr:hypothetical protein BKA83DRAFT_4260540 [Pisolithus microcarpus]KAI6036479.1 hypothetical protein BKA83DRAFT_4163406 [Pisolithus microcarpus]